ncbi:putative Aldose 1-epimerase [metagenome]|uniref:Putative Aldose 1-epimerase n=1 Tax=metagenome TaxID=256318 RepID=A0A2P2CBD3_9ZZZZ
MSLSAPPVVRREPFGESPRGPVERFVLHSERVELSLLSWAATTQSLRVRTETGGSDELMLGFPDLSSYLADQSFVGAVIGRYANRIAGGRFRLDGVEHRVPTGGAEHALHGGPDGFHRQVWSPRPFASAQGVGVEFSHVSPDGQMGFPGTLASRVTYTLAGSTVRIDFAATTDRPTVVNFTQHAYFNLAGQGTVEAHRLRVAASRYLPTDAGSIPLGRTDDVDGTPFDFRRARALGARLDHDDEQLRLAGGYDHSLLLDGPGLRRIAADLQDPASGRRLTVRTDAPAVHLYTGNHLPTRRSGVCLETQGLPNAPNQPGFPSTVLVPGQEFRSTTTWSVG